MRARVRSARARTLPVLARDAERILDAGQRAIEPGRLVARALRLGPDGAIRVGRLRTTAARVFVVAVGKAAVGMTRAARRILGRRWTRGIVVSSAAPARPLRDRKMQLFVAGHPVPDARGVRAGRAVIGLLEAAREEDLVLLLLSGGASALLPAPCWGISLSEKQRITRLLLARGATIDEINAVRARLSRLKGGGFARLASPARVVTLALSDVPGDDPAVIGSGPAVTAASRSARDVGALVRKYLRGARLSRQARRRLAIREKPAAPLQREPVFHLVGSARTFLDAAAREARRRGYLVALFPARLRGEARLMGPQVVRRFLAQAGREPRAHLWSGETIVQVRGTGVGGRNLELALASVPHVEKSARTIVLVTRATDGVDGPSGAAGAVIDPRTASRLRRVGVSVSDALAANDAFSALKTAKVTRITGPTGTNVGDAALILG